MTNAEWDREGLPGQLPVCIPRLTGHPADDRLWDGQDRELTAGRQGADDMPLCQWSFRERDRRGNTGCRRVSP
jgi:hypothetical protein